MAASSYTAISRELRGVSQRPQHGLTSVSIGVWEEDEMRVKVLVERGKNMMTMGVHVRGTRYLYLEEAIYLVDCGSLEVIDRNRSVSLPHLWSFLRSSRVCPNLVATYLHLKRLGYLIMRHSVVLDRKRKLDHSTMPHSDSFLCCWKTSSMKTSTQTPPDYCILIRQYHNHTPSNHDIELVLHESSQLGCARACIAAVDNFNVAFFEFGLQELPDLTQL